jgi:methylmalonyl-CoA/ethylmalonyl-CoA epimerase
MTSAKSAAISGLSHVAIAVPDIAAASSALEKRLGIKAGPVHENVAQGVRLAYIDLGNARIELISPMSVDSPIAKFLERNPGGGLHHVAFNVGDIDAALAAAVDAGARQAGKTGKNVHGDRIAFLSPKELLGALVELEEKHR